MIGLNEIYSFEPVHAPDARALILGTMPSVESLRQSFYYAHPRNCFWPMMAEILGEPRPETPLEKRALLIRHRIALWDVARCCVREGSLDSDIRQAQPNDIPRLMAACPDLQVILFNGGTAKRLFDKLLPGVGAGLTRRLLPSTSPALTMKYEQKLAAWADAIRSVEGVVDQ